uniref:Uncharacterized protein n=1 Tax=Brassica oleracea var. oleracea TaxID=109376 RepID=A0A0D3CSH5_BRAOL
MLHLLRTDPAIYQLQIPTLKALFKSIHHDLHSTFNKSKSIMANSSVFLADLKASRCTSTAQVRLLRFWEDRNVNRDGEVYSVSGFELSDSPLSIRFNNETGLKDLTDPGSPIPQERFRFCNDELLGLANTNTHLPETSFLIYPSRYELIDKFVQEHGLTESFLRACPIGIMPDGSEGIALREETAENKSCLADVDVKLLEFDAMIKKLSRRRPEQLIKTIASLEDLHLSILHTYMTTMEQTVLYSFNVKARKVDVEGFLSAQAATDAIKGSMDLYAMNIPVESVPPDSRFYVEIRTDPVNTENEWNRRAGSLTLPSL